MDNKLTLRQIAPGLFSNPEGPAQIIPPSLQQPQPAPMEPSMQDKILAALAQSGMLGQVDNALQQMPQKEDFSTLVNGLKNRVAEPPENSPMMPSAKPSMQPSRSMEQPAQVTNQAAQRIGGQVAPSAEDDVDEAIKMRQFQKGFRGE